MRVGLVTGKGVSAAIELWDIKKKHTHTHIKKRCVPTIDRI